MNNINNNNNKNTSTITRLGISRISAIIEENIIVDGKPKNHKYANQGFPAAYALLSKSHFDKKSVRHFLKSDRALIKLIPGKLHILHINGLPSHPLYLVGTKNKDTELSVGGSLNDPQNIMLELQQNGIVEAWEKSDNIIQTITKPIHQAIIDGTIHIDLTTKKNLQFMKRYNKIGYACENHPYMGGPFEFRWTLEIPKFIITNQNTESLQKSKSNSTKNIKLFTANDIEIEMAVLPEKFQAPTALTSTPLWPNQLFIAEQHGKVYRFDLETQKTTLFLDYTRFVRRLNLSQFYDERGLLDINFHPDFSKENPEFFIYYSVAPRTNDLVNHYGCLSVVKVDVDDKRAIDGTEKNGRPNSEVILMKIAEPFSNHNGGRFVFGNTEKTKQFIYLGTGDGGSAFGPGNRSQNLANVHGKILRIDYTKNRSILIRAKQGGSELELKRYGIPKSNPYYNVPGALKEIWAVGLRNPWGLDWFDQNESLIVADVGQNELEELNVVRAGKNYGWPWFEGTRKTRKGEERFTEKGEEYENPVLQYKNTNQNSIIGGYLVKENPNLYVFGDFQSQVFVAQTNNNSSSGSGAWSIVARMMFENPKRFVRAFGKDAYGNIYVLTSREQGPGMNDAEKQNELFQIKINFK